MTALPITAKIAEGDTRDDGQRRFYGQIDIGPGDVQITAYESLGQDGVVIIDIDRTDAGEGTPVKVAINDWYVDDTTREQERVIRVTTEDSWDLFLRGLKDACIRVNDQQELAVQRFDELSGTLYGRQWDELHNWWSGPEVTISVDTIQSIHIL